MANSPASELGLHYERFYFTLNLYVASEVDTHALQHYEGNRFLASGADPSATQLCFVPLLRLNYLRHMCFVPPGRFRYQAGKRKHGRKIVCMHETDRKRTGLGVHTGPAKFA